MAKKKKSDTIYCFSRIVNVIFALIPFTNYVAGIVTRIRRGKWFCAILNIILPPIFYFLDLFGILLFNKLIFLV